MKRRDTTREEAERAAATAAKATTYILLLLLLFLLARFVFLGYINARMHTLLGYPHCGKNERRVPSRAFRTKTIRILRDLFTPHAYA